MLANTLRFIGGITLAPICLFFGLMSLTGIFSGDGMGTFAGLFCIGLAVLLGQLAAMCFSSKYAQSIAKRDYQKLL